MKWKFSSLNMLAFEEEKKQQQLSFTKMLA